MAEAAAPRPYSLKRRLSVGASSLFALMIAVLSMGLWHYSHSAASRTYDLLLSGAAISILERLALTPDGLEIDLPTSAFDILALAPNDRVFYKIVGDDGTTLTGDAALPGLDDPPPVEEDDAIALSDARFDGEPVRLATSWLELPGAGAPVRIGVAVGQTTLARRAMRADLFLKGLIPLAAVAAAGLVALRTGVALAIRPLVDIERDIRARAPTDLSPLTIAPPRESDALVGAINDFMRRLGASRDNAQSFIADVAHQLRTALFGVEGALAPQASAAPEEQVARGRERVRRTIHLTNQLLSHAMVIHRADNSPPAEVDPAALVRRTLEDTLRDGVADTIGLAVEAEPGSEGARLMGDAVALGEALRNLVDNAIRHGAADNAIVLRLAPETIDGRPALALIVADQGPGIAAADRAAVKERFVTRDDRGGSGLGLAIVAAVARSHHGRLDLRDAPGGGLEAALVVPRSDRATAPPPAAARG
ncbi:sensor histidine kinase [Acuticoccus sp. I52.16.1]|uniref:sensor histidine kinase n=1 Tax=Acuticoccus sp. I52.16.1 TaxID=2928472 RepID=UPI001FD363B1|nr:sensor histidine kinase [Acuticoccus sp. I52.16.1]UOM32698.1 sensor histidine kinase N-terminal domain-containing protein [Acuticoccus sp. I52.16.1]